MFKKDPQPPWSEELFNQVIRHGNIDMRLSSMSIRRSYVPSRPELRNIDDELIRQALPAHFYQDSCQVQGIITRNDPVWGVQSIECDIELRKLAPDPGEAIGEVFFDRPDNQGKPQPARLYMYLHDPDGMLEDALRQAFATASIVRFAITVSGLTWETVRDSERGWFDIYERYRISEWWDAEVSAMEHLQPAKQTANRDARLAAGLMDFLISALALFVIIHYAPDLAAWFGKSFGLPTPSWAVTLLAFIGWGMYYRWMRKQIIIGRFGPASD
jgi:hypothetical protein